MSLQLHGTNKGANQSLDLSVPRIMGILNVTPDSFSDGGRFLNPAAAVRQAQTMLMEGADIIDVGGESTRPGAVQVSVDEELQRVLPVIKAIRAESDCLISIDTSKPKVMREAVNAGANIVNDVCALQEPGVIEVVAELDVPVCLMHMQGQPRNMQHHPAYDNVVAEVKAFLQQRIHHCVQNGINKQNIIIDPGFGFGKSLQHNIEIFNALEAFVATGFPVLVGMSRKSMLDKMLGGASPEQRITASVVMAALAVKQGVQLLRVHDVKQTMEALKIHAALNSLPDT